jgi:hypothetical protein
MNYRRVMRIPAPGMVAARPAGIVSVLAELVGR